MCHTTILVLGAIHFFSGSLINKYLECSTELDDHAIHLLFSANRWELLYVAFIHKFFWFNFVLTTN